MLEWLYLILIFSKIIRLPIISDVNFLRIKYKNIYKYINK